MTTAIVIGSLILIGLLIVNRRAVGQMLGWGKAQVGHVGRAFENADPVGQMQQKADDAKEELKKAKTALITCEGIKVGLERQLEADNKDVARLTARINQAMAEGKTDDDPVLIEYAKQLKAASTRLEENKAQLEMHVGVYQNTLNSVKKAGEKIQALETRATQLGARLKTSEAQAMLADLLDKFEPGAINSTLGEASKFEEIAQRKIDENNARLKVNQDLGTGSEVEEYEDNADAKNILADLRAKQTHQLK